MNELRSYGEPLLWGSLEAALAPAGFVRQAKQVVRKRPPLSDHFYVHAFSRGDGSWEPSLLVSVFCKEYMEKAKWLWREPKYEDGPLVTGVDSISTEFGESRRKLLSRQDAEAYAADMTALCRDKVVPFLDRFQSPDDIARFWLESNRKPQLIWTGAEVFLAEVWLGMTDPDSWKGWKLKDRKPYPP